MSSESLRLRLVSAGPLVMNASRLADPLDPDAQKLAAVTGKRRKTLADHRRIADIEWSGKLWAHQGRACLPPDAIEKAFEDACKTRNHGATLAAAVVVDRPALLEYEGPKDLKRLAKDADFRFRKLVRVRKALTPRTRPLFADWSAIADVTFLATVINREQVIDLFRIAGSQIGIGDWRKRYGKFTVEDLPPD
ncbi:hypothetical protein [Bradyrhizobium sp.]|uniref:hypothetical protein n=1 Tax=Bradyrhizobium sp. TaxID=376 RepID=UPI00263650A7|nr:hypothetical protein [Bradyrhizobium sp.]